MKKLLSSIQFHQRLGLYYPFLSESFSLVLFFFSTHVLLSKFLFLLKKGTGPTQQAQGPNKLKTQNLQYPVSHFKRISQRAASHWRRNGSVIALTELGFYSPL